MIYLLLFGCNSLSAFSVLSGRTRSYYYLFFFFIFSFLPANVSYAKSASCVTILHDQQSSSDDHQDIFYALSLANLMGHWPQYEVRVQLVQTYKLGQADLCHATIYLGTNEETNIPKAFLDDYFKTNKSIAWIGYGLDQLDSQKFENIFEHKFSGVKKIQSSKYGSGSYYKYVIYKDHIFEEKITEDFYKNAYDVFSFKKIKSDAKKYVISYIKNNQTDHKIPFILRSGSKFVVTKMPLRNMEATGPYAVVADLLFDILREPAYRATGLAFARFEDVHGRYDMPLLASGVMALTEEDVPVTISHIPLFMDPHNAFGQGAVAKPEPADIHPKMRKLLVQISRAPRNAIVWHGVTHQYAAMKNPYSGLSGHDYEFWDYNRNAPIPGSSHGQVISRLEKALSVFNHYHIQPRYWLTPHYQASAAGYEVFGAIFPWSLGRNQYYSSAFKREFTLPAVSRMAALRMESPNRKKLTKLRKRWPRSMSNTHVSSGTLAESGRSAIRQDFKRSRMSFEQVFPYEIYRDVYGQRIIPETLYYVSRGGDLAGPVRTVDDMLRDAKKGQVLRDYWASFFFHPFLLANKEKGGIGRYAGDSVELRKLINGLRMLGYRFIGLPEFEGSLENAPIKNLEEVLASKAKSDTYTSSLQQVGASQEDKSNQEDIGTRVLNIFDAVLQNIKSYGENHE